VVVLPACAGGSQEACRKIEEARALLTRLGGQVGKELRAAGGLTARLTGEQAQALRQAGYQVLEDRKVQVLPPRPRRQDSLAPGWLLTPQALDAASRALSALGRDSATPALGPAPGSEAPVRPSSGPVPQAPADTLSFWPDFGPPGGFAPMPFGAARQRPAESPSMLTGELPTTGRGVGIAIVDSGLFPHPDLADRLVAFHSPALGTSRPQDPLGHGTHVAGDAAGDGKMSGGSIKGPAPGAHLIGIQVLGGEESEGRLSEVIDNLTSGLHWMVQNKDRYNIRVANLSLGIPLLEQDQGLLGLLGLAPQTLYDPIAAAVNQAVAAGITVVAAAGNEGSEPGTIAASPAINDKVITVGALDTEGTPERHDDRVAEFSSRGPTPDGRLKPDLVAPGVNILAPNSPGSSIEQQNAQIAELRQEVASMRPRELRELASMLVESGMAPPRLLQLGPEELRQMLLEGLQVHPTVGRLGDGAAYMAMDGTSMSSPIVAGVVAAMLEANPRLTPAQVKEILKATADRLPGVRSTDQGAGVLDAREAVETAARLARD
jgi:subtilisin family serine protease